jgi:hypothetical protein
MAQRPRRLHPKALWQRSLKKRLSLSLGVLSRVLKKSFSQGKNMQESQCFRASVFQNSHFFNSLLGSTIVTET